MREGRREETRFIKRQVMVGAGATLAWTLSFCVFFRCFVVPPPSASPSRSHSPTKEPARSFVRSLARSRERKTELALVYTWRRLVAT